MHVPGGEAQKSGDAFLKRFVRTDKGMAYLAKTNEAFPVGEEEFSHWHSRIESVRCRAKKGARRSVMAGSGGALAMLLCSASLSEAIPAYQLYVAKWTGLIFIVLMLWGLTLGPLFWLIWGDTHAYLLRREVEASVTRRINLDLERVNSARPRNMGRVLFGMMALSVIGFLLVSMLTGWFEGDVLEGLMRARYSPTFDQLLLLTSLAYAWGWFVNKRQEKRLLG